MVAAASAYPPRRTTGATAALRALGVALLWLALALSGIVFFEPAPYDVLMPLAMLALLASGLPLPRHAVPVLLLLAIFVAGGLVGAAVAKNGVSDGLKHFAITAYLSATAVVFAAYAAADPLRHLDRVFKGYCIAAAIAALAAVLAYFDFTGLLDPLFLNERARATFKDPNVLGPFLVAPALYAIHRAFSKGVIRGAPWAAFAALVAVAVLLTFSRGAWGHLLLSAVVLVYFMILVAPDARARAQLVLLSGLAVALLALLVVVAMTSDVLGPLLSQRAALTQIYDVGELGRFGRQVAAVGLILDNPLGIGFGEFERIYPEQPHNVYLSAFVTAGWLGGFAYVGLVASTLAMGFAQALRRTPWQPYCLVVYAAFVGEAGEGLLIDSDHWRHFYLLMGLLWGIFAANGRYEALVERI